MNRRIIKDDSTKLVYTHFISNKAQQTVLFLPGFMSNRHGSKAVFLHRFCQERHLDYLCLDYRGHGESGGVFTDLTLSDWLDDSLDVAACSQKPLIVVGSSMGGWLGLLLAQRLPEKIKSLILLAPAPDFTEQLEKAFSAEQQLALNKTGLVSIDLGYEQPHIFTKSLISDGKKHLILEKGITIGCPVSILQGKQDTAVDWRQTLRLAGVLRTGQLDFRLAAAADHSLTRPEDLQTLSTWIEAAAN